METPEDIQRSYEFAEKILTYDHFYLIESNKSFLARMTHHPDEIYWTNSLLKDLILFNNKKDAQIFMKSHNIKAKVRMIEILIHK